MGKLAWLFAVVMTLGAGRTLAAPLTFDFKDPKSVNSMTLAMFSELEPIMGVASGVTGTLTFDPDKPEALAGKLTVDATTITFPNTQMTKVAHSADWLDVAKYPTIEFEITSAKLVEKKSDTRFILEVSGSFTCHGVTKPLTATVDAAYLPGKAAARHRQEGDLLVLRSTFSVDRREYQIQLDRGPDIVSYDVQVGVGIVGHAAR